MLDAVELFPHENFLFYGDTQNVPYGEKRTEAVKALTLEAVAGIVAAYDVKALVLACNTATSAAVAPLREIYDFSILGMEPAIKPALTITQNNLNARRVLLLSTTLTMQSEKLAQNMRKIDPENRVDCIPLGGLVDFAEAMQFAGLPVTEYLKVKVLNLHMEHYGAVVLGCTHFIWYKDLLQKLLPAHVKLFDGNAGTLKHLRNTLARVNELAVSHNPPREILLHFTGNIDNVKLETLIGKIKMPVKVL